MARPPPEPSYPNAAYLVSLLGGVFIVLGGLTDLATGALLRSTGLDFAGLGAGAKILLIALGVVGLVVGLVVVYGALQLRNHPEGAHTWGILIVAFSLVSLVGSSGFLVGLALGLIGGVLALRWHPSIGSPASSPAFRDGSSWDSTSPTVSPMRPTSFTATLHCLFCGSPYPLTSKSCPKCGAGFPEP